MYSNIVCKVTYKVPEPSTSPESETTALTTQTSDVLPVVTIALAVITLLSAAVVVSKKTF